MITKEHLETELNQLNEDLKLAQQKITDAQTQYNAIVGAILMSERLLKKLDEEDRDGVITETV